MKALAIIHLEGTQNFWKNLTFLNPDLHVPSVIKVSFPGNFAYVLHECSLISLMVIWFKVNNKDNRDIFTRS